MSAINYNIVLNWTVEENCNHKENVETERKGRDSKCNLSRLVSKQGETWSYFEKEKKCDVLWITPFGDTICCIRNKICRKGDCSGRWIRLEKHFAKASKAVALFNKKENCAISSQSINGGRRTRSAPRTNQTICQLQSEKNSLRQNNSGNKRKKVKGHVISKQSSLAIAPFLSSHNLILTHYILLGK